MRPIDFPVAMLVACLLPVPHAFAQQPGASASSEQPSFTPDQTGWTQGGSDEPFGGAPGGGYGDANPAEPAVSDERFGGGGDLNDPASLLDGRLSDGVEP
jgi:hypothetical protein